MKTIDDLIAKNIRERRLERGWTQEKLASEANLHAVSINRIETLDRRAGAKALAAIAKALGCTQEDLIKSDANEASPTSPDILESIERGVEKVLSARMPADLPDDLLEALRKAPPLKMNGVRAFLGLPLISEESQIALPKLTSTK